MVDFGESDAMIKIREKWINQTLTTGFPLIFIIYIYIYRERERERERERLISFSIYHSHIITIDRQL